MVYILPQELGCCGVVRRCGVVWCGEAGQRQAGVESSEGQVCYIYILAHSS